MRHLRQLCAFLLLFCLLPYMECPVRAQTQTQETPGRTLFMAHGIYVRTMDYEAGGSFAVPVRMYQQLDVMHVGHRQYRLTGVLHTDSLAGSMSRRFKCVDDLGEYCVLTYNIQYDAVGHVRSGELIVSSRQFNATYVDHRVIQTYRKYRSSLVEPLNLW